MWAGSSSQRLAKAIKAVQEQSGAQKVFVRLSTRSPKDAVDKRPDMVVPLLRQHLADMAKKLKLKSPSKLSLNDQLICIRRCGRY